MNRLVIYTCVTGSYDAVKELSVRVPWADYVLFTDAASAGKTGTEDATEGSSWQVRPIFWAGSGECPEDKISLSRYPKLNPHAVLSEYEYSLWIDGNVDICSMDLYERLEQMIGQGVLYGGLQHPLRDDIYEESVQIVKNERETLWRAFRMCAFLTKEGMPRDWGLYENNVILRKHNDQAVIGFDNLWWSLFSKYSRRDQLSWSYCMWKTGLKHELILQDGKCARDSEEFGYSVHDKPYVKDISFTGRVKDAVRAAKVLIYKLCLAVLTFRL